MAKKTKAKTPVSAFILLGLGVVIAVAGFGVVSFAVSEDRALVISGITLLIGVTLALIGVKRLRPAPKRRRSKK